MQDAELLGRLAQYAIIAFVVLIALDQIEVGGDIVRQTLPDPARGRRASRWRWRSGSAGRDWAARAARALVAARPTRTGATRNRAMSAADAAPMRPRSPLSGPAGPIRSAPPGTARASTSRCSPSTPNEVELCLFDAERPPRAAAHRAARAHRPRLALLPARGAARAALRLPRARPLPARGGPPLQPAQAAARSVRARHRRRSCAGATRSSATRVGHATRGPLVRPARQRARHAQVPRDRPRLHLGRRPPPDVPWHDTVIYELHVRGFTMRHPGRAAARCAAPTPALATRAGDRPPASASASPRSSCCRCTRSSTTASWSSSGLRNYWGYNTHRLLRARSALLARRGKVNEFKTMVQDAALGRHRGDPRRRLQPHRRRQPARADAVASAASTTRRTTA